MSNPIEWCDSTINIITGCTNSNQDGMCQGKFPCYAEGFARRLAGKERKHPGSTGYPTEPGQHFKPTFHWDKHWNISNLPLRGKPKRVFLDSMSDWFCEGVPAEWVQRIIAVLWEEPRHHFIVLTKRPERILETLHCTPLPTNLWVGVSVTCQEDVWRIQILKDALPGVHKFVSIEPFLGPIKADMRGIEWIIIGAETGRRKDKVIPDRAWLQKLGEEMRQYGGLPPVFLKENIRLACGWDAVRKEFPQGME